MALITWTTLTTELIKALRLNTILNAIITQVNGYLDRSNVQIQWYVTPTVVTVPCIVNGAISSGEASFVEYSDVYSNAPVITGLGWKVGIAVATAITVSVDIYTKAGVLGANVWSKAISATEADEVNLSPVAFNPDTQYIRVSASKAGAAAFAAGDHVSVTLCVAHQLITANER